MSAEPSVGRWQRLARRLDSSAVRLYQHPDKRLAEIGHDCALAAELIRSCAPHTPATPEQEAQP